MGVEHGMGIGIAEIVGVNMDDNDDTDALVGLGQRVWQREEMGETGGSKACDEIGEDATRDVDGVELGL